MSGGIRPPGFGSPSKPGEPQKRNGPLVAVIVGALAVLLLLTCVLPCWCLPRVSVIRSAAKPQRHSQQPIATTLPTATADRRRYGDGQYISRDHRAQRGREDLLRSGGV